MDPTFNIPKKRAKEILKLIKKYRENKDVSVTVELRVDLLDQEIMDLLKDANITVIEVGLQSSNMDVMKAVDRKQSTKLIAENVKYMQGLGMETVIQLIYGLPEETINTYMDSIDYSVDLNVSKVEPYQLQLLPGTPMYKSADLLGLNFIDHGERKIVSTRSMSEIEVSEAGEIAELVQVFYNNKVARSSLKWYSKYSGKSFSSILQEYKDWRLENISGTLRDWHEEGSFYIYDYFQFVLDNDFDRLWPLLHDLVRFDRYSSHLNFIGDEVYAAFRYDPVAAVAALGQPFPEQACWYCFRTDQRINSNFFNGQFLRKSFERIDAATAEAFNRGRLPDGIESIEVLVARAEAALQSGDGATAERLLRAALPVAPEHGEVLHLLGITMAMAGLFDEAVRLLRRAVESDRAQPLYRATLGAVCAEAGRSAEAEREYRIAIGVNPNLIEAHFNLGNLLSETERLAEAESEYRAALSLNPELVEAHYNLGEVLTEMGRHDEAAACYQKAASLAPELFEDAGRTQH
jgi:Flp pilus assembly protein TadD